MTLGADSTVRAWSPSSGKQTNNVELPALGYRIATTSESDVVALALERGGLAVVRFPKP